MTRESCRKVIRSPIHPGCQNIPLYLAGKLSETHS